MVQEDGLPGQEDLCTLLNGVKLRCSQISMTYFILLLILECSLFSVFLYSYVLYFRFQLSKDLLVNKSSRIVGEHGALGS